MTTPCGKLACPHLEPCCREEGHDPPCWPWLEVEFPAGVWRITVVNANDDGTAGPLALKAEAIGGPPTLDDVHQVVVGDPGYPDQGLRRPW